MISIIVVSILFSSVYAAPDPIVATVTCDNILTFYVDGVEVSLENGGNWRKADTVEISPYAHVIAMECVDKGVIGGIKASFSNGYETDNKWRCTNLPAESFEGDWQSETFSDQKWERATVHTDSRWGNQPSELQNINWIWTSDNTNSGTVKCRRRFECEHGTYAPHPKRENWFRQCVWGRYRNIKCPRGLVWNQQILNCDYPAESEKCTHGEYSPVPNNPNKFYQCVHGSLVEFSCPASLVWNQSLSRCDWPEQ